MLMLLLEEGKEWKGREGKGCGFPVRKLRSCGWVLMREGERGGVVLVHQRIGGGEKRIEVLYDKRMRLYCGVYFLVGRGEECKIEIV
jgi:hypothetical protein